MVSGTSGVTTSGPGPGGQSGLGIDPNTGKFGAMYSMMGAMRTSDGGSFPALLF